LGLFTLPHVAAPGRFCVQDKEERGRCTSIQRAPARRITRQRPPSIRAHLVGQPLRKQCDSCGAAWADPETRRHL